MCLFAVEKDPAVLKLISDQEPEICWASIKQDPRSLQYVKKQTPEMCLYSIEKDGLSYQFVKIVDNPNHETTIKNLKLLQNQLLIKATISNLSDSN